MSLWKAGCVFVSAEGKACKQTGMVIEKGEPRCVYHTRKVLAAKARALGAKGISKREKAEKRAEKEQRAAVKWDEHIAKCVKEKRSFGAVGALNRSKPWHLCQVKGCRKVTQSGVIERDIANRYCFIHEPAKLALFKLEAAEGRFRHGKCVTNRIRFKGCRFRYQPIACGVSPRAEAMCGLIETRCFDIDRKWKIRRIRCLVNFRVKRPVGPVFDRLTNREVIAHCIHCERVKPSGNVRSLWNVCPVQPRGESGKLMTCQWSKPRFARPTPHEPAPSTEAG